MVISHCTWQALGLGAVAGGQSGGMGITKGSTQESAQLSTKGYKICSMTKRAKTARAIRNCMFLTLHSAIRFMLTALHRLGRRTREATEEGLEG